MLALLACLAAHESEARIRTVILISVDGLGLAQLDASPVPEIKRLMGLGASSLPAVTVDPPRTIPGHVSMMSGLRPERHRSFVNERKEGLGKVNVPTLFDLVAANRLKTTAVFGKEKLRFVFDTGAIQDSRLREWPFVGDFPSRFPKWVARQAAHALERDPPALLFLHFAWVDTMGHWAGWGSGTQRTAIQEVDAAIGEVVAAAHRFLAPCSFAILITSDHGGHDGSHGQRDPATGGLVDPVADLPIPFILYGAGLRAPEGTASIVDTAPTVARLLRLEIPGAWRWQGRSLSP